MRSRTPPLGSSPRLLQLEKKSPRSNKDPEQPKNKFFKLFFKKKKLNDTSLLSSLMRNFVNHEAVAGPGDVPSHPESY